MVAKNKLLLVLSFILLALVLASYLSPFFVARGVALWLRYQARRSGATISTGQISAPFLRPVEIRDLRIVRAGTGAPHLQIDAPRVEAAFRLAALFERSQRSHPLRSLTIEHARVSLRGRAIESAEQIDWHSLAALLPEQFDFSADQILFEQPFGRLELHDARISGNDTRSGEVSIASLQLRGPYLKKSFTDVHGVTRWQDSRLTIGSLQLLEGLRIDSLALDFTRLRETRIAADLATTIFNGNMRANFATERTGNSRLWEAAGSASGISLSQLAPALGLTEPLTGSLRASKFSFRGDPRDFLHATASLWTELTGFSWRERQADVIMIGANFYERTVQLQELYIKQQNNELTLSGETALAADWLNPDFRGDVSGSINDLGQFAELFGASADAFAGKVAVRGRVHAHEHKVDGELALTGDALTIARNPVDSLTARLTLDSPRLRCDQFELRRGEDFLRGSGQVDFAHHRSFQILADGWFHDLSEYGAHLPLLGVLSGNLFAQIDASGDENTSKISLRAQMSGAKFATNGTWRGDTVEIDSFAVTMNNASAAFAGSLKISEPRKLTLSPHSDVRLAQNLDQRVCMSGFEMQAGDFGTPLSQITVTQNQLALTDPVSTTQTAELCPDEQDAGQPLRISVPSPTPASSPTPSPTPTPSPPAPLLQRATPLPSPKPGRTP
jgi:hypothetical protein